MSVKRNASGRRSKRSIISKLPCGSLPLPNWRWRQTNSSRSWRIERLWTIC